VIRPQALRPDRQAVPAVPGRAELSFVLRPVLLAPSLSGEHRASRMPARPQRRLCHGSLRAKRKSLSLDASAFADSSRLRLKGSGSSDVNLVFSSAVLAVDRKRPGFRLLGHPQELLLAAVRAAQEAACYWENYTIFVSDRQHFFASVS